MYSKSTCVGSAVAVSTLYAAFSILLHITFPALYVLMTPLTFVRYSLGRYQIIGYPGLFILYHPGLIILYY